MKNPTTFQLIFLDHYEEIVYTLHPRPIEIDNINRMLKCGDEEYGYHGTNAKIAIPLNDLLFIARAVFAPPVV